jgi:DNA polymerase-3 subunit gamma/tau
VLIKDLMDAVVEVSRAQALKDEYSFAGPADWVKRTRAMADKLSPAQAARMWRLLLQGFEDCARAPDPPAAAQMVVLRLAAAASLPSPEDAAKLLAGGAAVPGPKSQPERAQAGRAEPLRGQLADTTAVAEEESHHGVHMSSLREIIGELERQRQIDLKYDIEKFVRPAEIDFGHFRYSAAPGTPKDLSARIKDWLERVSGVEWEVFQSNDGAAESPSEARTRRRKEKIKAAEGHPRIAEALKVFKGARVLKVEEPDAQEELDEAPARPNVIHVDFARDEPEPEEREDED